MSQTDMAYEVLARSGHPLHIRDIVEQIQVVFGVSVSRDSLVSAVMKKVANQRRFVKTGKNTYGLLGRDRP
ncbi:MAG TPA: winged helix-turn-helix domain-containing protein [Bacillota bacterium]